MRKLLLFLSLLMPLPATAEQRPKKPDPADSCPLAAEMEPHIYMCGENQLVALQARYCAQDVAASWQAAAQLLLPVLQSRGQVANQNLSEEDTRRNYRDTVNAIQFQIRLMQHYTSVIEQYPYAMIDVPGSTGDDTSLSCFNEAFHQVQDVINFLDGEIIRAKKIRDAAASLAAISDSRHRSLSGSLTEGLAGGGGKAAGAGGSPVNDASTITGEIRNAFLNSQAAADQMGRNLNGGGPRPFTAKTGKRGERAGILAAFTHNDLFDKDSRVTAAGGQGAWARGQPGAGADSKSVGAVFFKEGDGNVKLTAEAEQALTAAGRPRGTRRVRFKVAALVGPSGQVRAFADGQAPLPLPMSPVAPGSSPLASRDKALELARPIPVRAPSSRASSLAAPDEDLFRLVSQRYRGTDLFRRARVITVPLDGFDSRLKR